MQQAPIVLIMGLGLSALLSAYLASYAQLHAKVFGARDICYLLLGVAVYSLGYAIEISHTDIENILMAINLEYIGLVFLPSLLMFFALHIVRGKSVSKGVMAGLLLIPVITLVIVFTQRHHNLFYINPHVVDSDLFSALSFERGLWYYVYIVFQQACALSAVVLLTKHALHQEKRKRKQTIMIVIGALVPITSGMAYYLGFIPYKLDVGPFSFTITGVIFAITIFKMGFLELVPAARELAMDAIKDALIVVDGENIIQDFNQAALKLPGGGKIKIGDSLEDISSLDEYLQPLLKSEVEQIEFSNEYKDNGKRYYQARAYQVRNHQNHIYGMAILVQDVTDTARLLRKLSYQANVDGLTGILNRRELMQQAEKEIEISCKSNIPLGIILIDLDHFKNINDTYGHIVGDEVLKKVVVCLRSGLRSIDILGRYGGEEFLILLPGVDVEKSLIVAERLRKEIQDHDFLINGVKVKLTASFGIHVNKPETDGLDVSIEKILAAADRALYKAKVAGRNQVACSS